MFAVKWVTNMKWLTIYEQDCWDAWLDDLFANVKIPTDEQLTQGLNTLEIELFKSKELFKMVFGKISNDEFVSKHLSPGT